MVAKKHTDLLCIDDSPDETESLIATLRNAGLAVRGSRLEAADQLDDALANPTCRLIVCSDHSSGMDVDTALAHCREQAPDIPVVVITAEHDLQRAGELLAQGARDVVTHQSPGHLEQVFARELQTVGLRSQVSTLTRQLSESESRCRTLVDTSGDAISYISEGMHVYANSTYIEMFGYSHVEELEGIPVMDVIAQEDHQRFKSFFRAHQKGNTEQPFIEFHGNTSGDALFDAIMELYPANYDGEPCTQIVVRPRDSANRVPAPPAASDINKLDPLTGMYNRQHFMAVLETAAAVHADEPGQLALIYIELDNYTDIRTAAGIATADAALIETSDRLQRICGERDTLARFREHVFTILTHRLNANAIEELCEDICLAIEESAYVLGELSFDSTVSIGICLAEPGADDAQTLVNHASEICERLHTDGGNRLAIYGILTFPDDDEPESGAGGENAATAPQPGDTAPEAATETAASIAPEPVEEPARIEIDPAMLENIQAAFEKDRFSLVFQPIVNIQGAAEENYCVMLRMKSTRGEDVPPNDFLPTAAASGLLEKIDFWVIHNSFRQLASHRKSGQGTHFFIKLSDEALYGAGITEEIERCRTEHGVDAGWLTFQLDADHAQKHLKETRELALKLRSAGYGFALDNMVLTPATAGLLKHVSMDFVWIAPGVTNNLAGSQENQDALTEIAAMARNANIRSIAKSVEDANSMAVLWTAGVDYIHGFFLQPPTTELNYDFSIA